MFSLVFATSKVIGYRYFSSSLPFSHVLLIKNPCFSEEQVVILWYPNWISINSFWHLSINRIAWVIHFHAHIKQASSFALFVLSLAFSFQKLHGQPNSIINSKQQTLPLMKKAKKTKRKGKVFTQGLRILRPMAWGS